MLAYHGAQLVSHAVATRSWVRPAGQPPLKTAHVDAVFTLPAYEGLGYATVVCAAWPATSTPTSPAGAWRPTAAATSAGSIGGCGGVRWRGASDGTAVEALAQGVERAVVLQEVELD